MIWIFRLNFMCCLYCIEILLLWYIAQQLALIYSTEKLPSEAQRQDGLELSKRQSEIFL